MKKLLVLVVAGLMLTGCGSKSNVKTTVCTANEKTLFAPSKATITHEDDVIKTMEIVMVLEAPSKEDADEALKMDVKEFAAQMGVVDESVNVKLNRNSDVEIEIVMGFDFAKNKEQLQEMLSVQLDKASEVIKTIEEDNFTCKTN